MGKLSTVLSRLLAGTDEEAMWQVKMRDDHRAFARLVARWEGPIRRLCTRMTGDSSRGEDLAQEAFARLFDKRKSYEPTGQFSTYFWRLTLNLCYDELRRVKRRQELFVGCDTSDPAGEETERPADQPGPDLLAARQEEQAIVRRAVLRLPELYRTVLVLRHYEGLKIVRIAEILEVPEGTVHSRLAEALARLTRALAPQLDQARPEPRHDAVCAEPSRAGQTGRNTPPAAGEAQERQSAGLGSAWSVPKAAGAGAVTGQPS